MLIVHVAFECAPIYKTGGLGDVVGSLPQALHRIRVKSIVAMPRYGWIKHKEKLPGSSIRVLYINSPWFEKPNIKHDHKIQAPKYAHFALQTLEELKKLDIRPDIIHCHDWHAALIPFILKKRPDAFFEKTKTLLTIHNIGYQGNFPVSYLKDDLVKEVFDLFDLFIPQQKKVSYLKLGIEYADYISTVSRNHAQEIRKGVAAFGIKTLIRKKRGRFTGILNGLDQNYWNPETDGKISNNYTNKSIDIKAHNKTALQKELRLTQNAEIPMYAFIARLTTQKGVEMLLPLLDTFISKRMQLVILGTGEKRFEKELLERLRKLESGWISAQLRFDEYLAHQIYAASDFFLVPSLYEPCGLTQMIAMRYGSIPIVTHVGGLADTVKDGVNGIVFEEKTESGLAEALNRAEKLWENKEEYQKMALRGMKQNFSWDKSAAAYKRLYRKISLI